MGPVCKALYFQQNLARSIFPFLKVLSDRKWVKQARIAKYESEILIPPKLSENQRSGAEQAQNIMEMVPVSE